VSDYNSQLLRHVLDQAASELRVSAGQVDRLLHTSALRAARRRRTTRLTATSTVAMALAATAVALTSLTNFAGSGSAPMTVAPASGTAAPTIAAPPRWSASYPSYLLQETQSCLASAGIPSQIDGGTLRVTASPGVTPPPEEIAHCANEVGSAPTRLQLTDLELDQLFAALTRQASCLRAEGTSVAPPPDVGSWLSAVRAGHQAWDPYTAASATQIERCPRS